MMQSRRDTAAKRAFDDCFESGDFMGKVGLELVDMPRNTVMGASRRVADVENLMRSSSRFRTGAAEIVLRDELAHSHETLGEAIEARAEADLACMSAIYIGYFIPEPATTHPCVYIYRLETRSVITKQAYDDYLAARKVACDGR